MLEVSPEYFRLIKILGPGLNAMANHGYMPRSGVGKMQDFIDGTAAVFGMGQS